MTRFLHRLLAPSLAVVAVAGLLLANPAQANAQFRGGARALPNSTAFARPWYYYPNPVVQSSINQYAYNVALLGRAYSYVPPYALGYNPYPAYVNYGPMYNYNPYAYNPYAYYNPYAIYGYGPIYNPYAVYGYYYGY